MRFGSSKIFLISECLLLFLGIPLLFLSVIPLRGLFALIWLAMIYTSVILSRGYGMKFSMMWQSQALTRANIIPILRRFIISAAAIATYVVLVEPERLFGFVATKPIIWALVMLIYPLLSVIPQEVIYRAFFFARYRPLFSSDKIMILMSALAFGFAHVVFNNMLAPLFCLIGGYYFSLTYQRTRSLALVWFEHSLYGCFIFTIGLGWYFFHGAH